MIKEPAFVYTIYTNAGSYFEEMLSVSKVIFLVDMQSFYASIEKATNPDYQNKPLVVSGDPARRSGIILAACPIAKGYGIKTAETLWEAQLKCPEVVMVRPRMQLYIDVSYHITKILEQFTDCIEVYSIDEQFIDITGSQHLFGTPQQIAEKIQQTIFEDVGIKARIGMGSNKVLAKMACDAFAKKSPNGIFRLDPSNLQEKLWPLPIGELFGVGRKMEAHLQKMGLHTIGNLANYPVKWLQKRWGINGELLWRTANGIDESPVTTTTHQEQKAVGHHMTLPRDYQKLDEIKVIVLELSEEVARRARAHHYIGQTVSINVQGSSTSEVSTGFNRQKKLVTSTAFGFDIYETAVQLFHKYWDGLPVRGIGITLAQLEKADAYQLSLFDDTLEKVRLNETMDGIYQKYGPTAIVRASSLMEAGQAHVRASKIGGHDKGVGL